MNIFDKVIKSWLLLASFVADSVVMVHVDWSEIHKEDRGFSPVSQTLRVLEYDVEQQQIVGLSYYTPAYLHAHHYTVPCSRGKITIDQKVINCTGVVQPDTAIIWRAASAPGDFPLYTAQAYNGIDNRTEKNNHYFRDKLVDRASERKTVYNATLFHSLRYKSLYSHYDTMPLVTQNAFFMDDKNQTSKDEKGILGELLTDLTFYSRGYGKWDSKLPASNGDTTNHGFDGIYYPAWEVLQSGAEYSHIFCTESKFRSESESENDLRKEIGTESLLVKIQKYTESRKDILLNYFKKGQMGVLAQCYRPDGHMNTPYYRDYSNIANMPYSEQVFYDRGQASLMTQYNAALANWNTQANGFRAEIASLIQSKSKLEETTNTLQSQHATAQATITTKDKELSEVKAALEQVKAENTAKDQALKDLDERMNRVRIDAFVDQENTIRNFIKAYEEESREILSAHEPNEFAGLCEMFEAVSIASAI